MLYRSTRGEVEPVDFTGALLTGLAPDGGLYVPETIPRLPSGWRGWDYRQAVSQTLELFGAADTADLVADAASRFRHPEVAPLVKVGDRLVFELFRGPTLSFKDHALQVLARLLDREVDRGVVLGATSGDTGSAAIEACRGSAHLRTVVLFPEGRVSEFQRRQMTTVPDDNVVAVAVKGTFDDCQAMVKEAFARYRHLLAFNSINWARIAAQTGYYVYLGARVGEPFDLVVPTGNFGNLYSAWTAKQMGVPIEAITIANNANHGLADLVEQGEMRPGPVVATVAPAMDIAAPSNLERFTADPTTEFQAGWSDDDQIRDTIAEVAEATGYVLDPHTATAWRAGAEHRTGRPQVVVATAHPAKFADTVERAIGVRPELPVGLEDLYNRPERFLTIPVEASALDSLIR
ncbi:MAG: threonine synthase [Acidimicrobiia bacterium]